MMTRPAMHSVLVPGAAAGEEKVRNGAKQDPKQGPPFASASGSASTKSISGARAWAARHMDHLRLTAAADAKAAPMSYAKPPLGLVDPLPPRTVSKRDRASAMARRARASPRPFST